MSVALELSPKGQFDGTWVGEMFGRNEGLGNEESSFEDHGIRVGTGVGLIDQFLKSVIVPYSSGKTGGLNPLRESS
jgi:hypothetical protein